MQSAESGILHSALCTLHLRWWEVLVMLQSSLPTVICDTGFTDRQPEHLPKKIRRPKSEGRRKSETRNPKSEKPHVGLEGSLAFEFWISDFQLVAGVGVAPTEA